MLVYDASPKLMCKLAFESWCWLLGLFALQTRCHVRRCKEAVSLGSQAIASVYEAAADCDGCEECRHILLKDYAMVTSDAQEGQKATDELSLPASGPPARNCPRICY